MRFGSSYIKASDWYPIWYILLMIPPARSKRLLNTPYSSLLNFTNRGGTLAIADMLDVHCLRIESTVLLLRSYWSSRSLLGTVVEFEVRSRVLRSLHP